MLQGWFILLVSLAYIGLLFAIAYYGDKRADAGRSLIRNPYTYALSMGVYCTAWTFYGSVGRAASAGVGFLPVYLGPTLMVALWWFVLRKIIRISKANRITSIADFIASRYGKSTVLGGLVTVIAVVGIIPYISLQLKGISTSFTVLWHYPKLMMPVNVNTGPVLGDTAFHVALLLAAFAILFGTRHLDATEHHEGLVAAIAFESVIKLLAFLAIGVFVTFGIYHGFADLFAQAAAQPALKALFTLSSGSYGDWAWLTFISMMAILFLPRQFQMAVVENTDECHLNKAIWLFPLYLLAINVFVLPITFGGLLHFPGGTVHPDTFVLTLPMAEGQETLALLVFIGGLSAATSMVIVETVALTTMVSNDLVMPVLLRWQALGLAQRSDLSGLLLGIRRGAIIVILLLSYGYFRLTDESVALVSIGLISFAAVAQFAPAILGGLYWKGGSRVGALVGLSAGFVVWSYTLPLPSLVDSGYLPQQFIELGPFGLNWLRPYALFGLEGLDPITHAMLWSMLVNAGGYMIVSLLSQQSVSERSQATLFVDVFKHSSEGDRARFWRGSASVAALRSLLGRFLGQQRVEEAFGQYARQRALNWSQAPDADAELVDFAEKLLAGAIGAASARVMVASVVKEEPLSLEEVMDILDETSQVIAYSHQLEQKSRELEAATAELRAANEQLKELDRLKDDFISTVTHELRTPLTSIRAFSEILCDNPDLDETRQSQFLTIILKESERLTRLINQVLDLSKIESGQMVWSLSEIDLTEVIKEALTATGQLFQEKNIQVELDLPERMPRLVADRDRIMQVLLNLLSNAMKFCNNQAGWVGIRLHVKSGFAQVDVSDNGPGIRPKDQEVIFEKFRQVGDTLTEKPQGTGLGLPICRHIITHFGGKLWVKSEPGNGATFSFTLPLQPQPVGSEIVETNGRSRLLTTIKSLRGLTLK
ncbi:MAG: histidine kinase [Anaerolineales bacterium]|nr:histidine kinase [Anaerolineales bacterium]